MKEKFIRVGCASLAAMLALSSAPALGLQQAIFAADRAAVHMAESVAAEEWRVGTLYEQGDAALYKGTLYQCRQTHTALPGWTPEIVPALWAKKGTIKPEKPEIIEVSSVKLSQSAVTVKVGKQVTLRAEVLPANATDRSLVWQTSNPTVAEVVNGVVTANAEGSAVITVKAGGKTASCQVTVKKEKPVKPEIIPVESIQLEKETVKLTFDSSKPSETVSVTLRGEVLPANATDKTIHWSSENSKIVLVDEKGNLTPVAAGSTVITAQAGGKTAFCKVIVEDSKTETPDPKPNPEPNPNPNPGETEKEPPVPFWKNYKNYAGNGTEVYYKGNIYQNKWYANAGAEPDKGDPWVLVREAEWTVKEDAKNYEKDEAAASGSINKILNEEEIKKLYGGINPEFSPEAALHRLDQLIPESAYNELFPYRFGSPAWKAAPSTKNYYPNPDAMPDYYSYDNLQKAVATLSNTIIKVQWYEGAEWCYRLIRLDKTTKEQKLIYSDENFDAEWIQTKPLCTSVCDYGSFLAEGDLNTRKRELAGFLANISHETGGGTVDNLTTVEKSGLYFNEEVGFIGSSAIGYVQEGGTSYKPVAGKSYHGRGPIQLSYNYNYGLCSDVLFGDSSKLLNDPDLIEQDGVLGFMTGIWFWMTPQPPKPSCHQVITGTWEPKSPDAPNAKYNGNFGLTIIIINNEAGQSENGVGAVARRAKYFRIFADKMGADITGEHCDTVGMGTFTQKVD